jgi:hypothetical protein
MSDSKPNGQYKFSLTSVMPVRANEGVAMEIRHPATFELMRNADGTPVSISLRGQTSRAFRQTVTAINRLRADQQLTQEQITSPEHVYETDTMLLVACTAGWNFDELSPGEPLPYSEENAQKLWIDERFDFLRLQATSFMLNNGNFLPAPSVPSSATPDTSSASTNLSPDQLAAE